MSAGNCFNTPPSPGHPGPRLAVHIGWRPQEPSHRESWRMLQAKPVWVTVGSGRLSASRHPLPPDTAGVEPGWARRGAPGSDRVAGFIRVHSSWKFPAKFPKICSYSWEEMRRQTEKLHGRQKEESPRANTHDLNCSSLPPTSIPTPCSLLSTRLRWKSAGALIPPGSCAPGQHGAHQPLSTNLCPATGPASL